MTLTNPPFALQGASHGAQLFRQAITSLLAPAGGIVQAGDFALTQNGSPNMSVNVGAGRIWIPGTSLSTVNPGGGAYYPQGSYYGEQDTATNLGISASDPTNPRIDTIIGQIQDAAYVGVTNSAALTVVTGTPTNGATLVNLTGAGAVPVSSLVLGYVLVPANATTIVTADLASTASTVLSAIPGRFLSGLDAAKPAAGTVKGVNYLATDSNTLYYSDGTNWRVVYGSRGATNIATQETTTSASYTTLTTPDQVTGIVLPANGLIAVGYQAVWAGSVAAAARAAIFIGSNQLKIIDSGGGVAPIIQETTTPATGSDVPLATEPFGLSSSSNPGYTGDVTTGQVLGTVPDNAGRCYIQGLPAGTYTIAIKFKTSSGIVSVKNRKLWVEARPFG